jgi:4-amino-4-deoxy-L-arabinose transferase-like glycosyltransferase
VTRDTFNAYGPVVLICAVAATLSFWRLSDAPMVIGGDEAYFALHAQSIASTGHDIDGRFLPLFFRIDLTTWYQPMLVYLMAPTVRLFGVSEWSIRAPIAFIGVVNVLLMYAIGQRLFADTRYAVLGALMLAMTPAHLILTRMALDYLCPLPFVLGWLWCLLTAIETDNVRLAFAGGLLLAVGFFSYIAAWFMMPVYFVITAAALIFARSRWRLIAAACLGFLAPLVPFMLWLRLHEDVFRTIVARYSLAGAEHSSVFQSLRYLLHYFVLQERISLYWRYFDPVYLFLTGSPDLALGTRKAGIFLVAVGVLLVYGIYDILRRTDRGVLLLAGFASAPVAPVLINSGNAIQRQVVLLPFGVLIAVYGIRRLLQSGSRPARTCAWLLLLALPMQFAYFAHDYFTDYRSRAADRIDPINVAEVARVVLGPGSPSALPRFYLSESLDDGMARWRFYLAKYHREDVWDRTWVLDPSAKNHWSVLAPLPTAPFDGDRIPAGSLFLLNANDPAVHELVGSQKCCALIRTIRGANGGPVSLLIGRLP